MVYLKVYFIFWDVTAENKADGEENIQKHDLILSGYINQIIIFNL